MSSSAAALLRRLVRLWQGTVATRLLVTLALIALAGQTMLVLVRVFEPDIRFAGLHLVPAFRRHWTVGRYGTVPVTV